MSKKLESADAQNIGAAFANPPEPNPYTTEGLTELINGWENLHLAKIDPKIANVEFGMIAAVIQKIGERCNRRLVAATQGKCGACGKPLGGRPFNQISIFNVQTGKFDEKYACSSKCSEKLTDQQHKAAVTQQTEG